LTTIIQLMPAVPVAVLPLIPAIIITIASSTSRYGPKYPFAPGIKAVPGSVEGGENGLFQEAPFVSRFKGLRSCIPMHTIGADEYAFFIRGA